MMDWGFFQRPGGWRARCPCVWCWLGRERRFIFGFSLSAWWVGVGGGSRAGCSVVGGTRIPFAFRYFSFIFIDFWLGVYIHCN